MFIHIAKLPQANAYLTAQQAATVKAHAETSPAPAPATYNVLGLKLPKTYAKVGGAITAGLVALKFIF